MTRPGTMPFGKFKGVLLADLPEEYLSWLHSLDLREPLKAAVEAEHRSRYGAHTDKQGLTPDVRVMAQEIVTAGYRRLAQIHHPDHGGDGQTMTLLNLAAEALRGVLRATG